MVSEKYLKIGRKIREVLNKRGAKLDYFAGTIIGEHIEDFVKGAPEGPYKTVETCNVSNLPVEDCICSNCNTNSPSFEGLEQENEDSWGVN